MKKLLLTTILLLSCDPNFTNCPSCQLDEDIATSVDGGEQLPIVVVVNVNVNQSQDQNQGQVQVQGQSNTNTTPVVDAGSTTVVHDAGVPDSGTPDAGQPKHDAGVPDAGKPIVDAGCHTPVCRKVCTCYEVHYVCKNSGKDTTNKSDCTCGVEKTYNQCTKEETKCQ